MKWLRIASAANVLFYRLTGRCLYHQWQVSDYGEEGGGMDGPTIWQECGQCGHKRWAK